VRHPAYTHTGMAWHGLPSNYVRISDSESSLYFNILFMHDDK